MPNSSILIVLDDFKDYASEIDRTGKLVSDLSLQNDLLISTVFVRESDWQRGQNPFIRNIRQEVIAA
ncbi:MAG: hypothetical protein HY584_02510 [Candidatus Omnitrophica bacterium]|nr:hypothetical protein [Candidatus Omnitrophota bacterium]